MFKFLFKHVPFVTISLLLINIVLYYTMNTWESLTLKTYDLQLVNFATSMFAHKDAMHLWPNMFGVLFAGIAAEMLLGRFKMLIIIIAQEIVVGYFTMNYGETMKTGGASGVGYALVVACIFCVIKVYVLERRSLGDWDNRPSPMQVIGGCCAMILSLITPMAMWDAWSQYSNIGDGIANYAHFWAGATGFIAALIMSIPTIKAAVSLGIVHLREARRDARLNSERAQRKYEMRLAASRQS